jgi:hypothetical protein
MVIRIGKFDQTPKVDEDKMAAFRKWMADQRGFVRGYHAIDPRSGAAISVSVWATMDDVLAMKDRTFPGGALGLKASEVTIYEVESEFPMPTPNAPVDERGAGA